MSLSDDISKALKKAKTGEGFTLSDCTRRTRKTLMAFSVIGIFIGFFDLTPQSLPSLGIEKLDKDLPLTLFALICIFYYYLYFIISCRPEVVSYRDKLFGAFIEKLGKSANYPMKDFMLRHWWSIKLSMDLGVPIVFGAIALILLLLRIFFF